MKGDFSRNTFDKKKHFTSVRMQQGRVQLDADWNEQMDILDNRIRIGSMDFIGGSGAPSESAGYQITLSTDKKDLTIGKGRYYVQGILIEKTQASLYSAQNLPENATLAKQTKTGLYLAYLDVWQQGISASEDSSIVEPALNGVDTTLRLKNIAQVKLLKLAKNYSGVNLSCDIVIDNDSDNKAVWQKEITNATGRLSVQVSSDAHLSNQLYRIEIHDSGNEDTATFKWSRNNGALVSRISSISGNEVTISNIEITALNFKAGQWVELTTEKRTLQHKPGIFVQLQKVTNNRLSVVAWPTGTTASEFIDGTLRKWDNVKTFVLPATVTSFLAVTNFKKNGTTITLDLPTISDAAKFNRGDFVELSVNKNISGLFIRLQSINNKQLTLTSSYPFKSIPKYIRPAGAAAMVTSNADNFINLENGLTIKFAKGSYRTGDYWLIPTRAATNTIASVQYDFSQPQLPGGITHYHTQIALLRKKADATWEIAGDCRNIISALGNKAYQSNPKAPAGSVFVDKDGKVQVKKQFQVDDVTELKKGASVTGNTKTTSLQLGSDATQVNTIATAITAKRNTAIPTEKAVQDKLTALEDMFIGSVSAFAMKTPPTGWLECNGSAVSRTTYAKLFTKIGTTFGVGDGSSSFNLPDLRGEFIRGWDHGKGRDPDAASRTNGGNVVGSTQNDAFQGHQHKLQSWFGQNSEGKYNPNNAGYAASGPHGNNILTREMATDTRYNAVRVSSETRPRNVSLMYCIKY